MTAAIRIDTNETFPHLLRAPIAEAVLEVRARAMSAWDEQTLAPELKARLPDYPQAKAAWESAGEFEFRGTEQPQQRVTEHAWRGIRVQSTDGRQIAQFNRDLFAFSRLAPYENWERFTTEALRLWIVHLELAQPLEVQRIGVRFINQLSVPSDKLELRNYYTVAPEAPREMELPLVEFTHRDTLEVPGHPYFVSITKTTQPAPKDRPNEVRLVLDIDVATRSVRPLAMSELGQHLPLMRWLKNKAFFGSFTPGAIAPLK